MELHDYEQKTSVFAFIFIAIVGLVSGAMIGLTLCRDFSHNPPF